MRIDKKIPGLLSCTLAQKKKKTQQKEKQIGQSPGKLFVAFFPFFVSGEKVETKTCEEKTHISKNRIKIV